MQSAKRNAVQYCNAFISHCANYYFSNENIVDLALLTKAQVENYKCIGATLPHFTEEEVDMLRCIFTSDLPLSDAMTLLNRKGEAGWFTVRKFIKIAAKYRGLI